MLCCFKNFVSIKHEVAAGAVEPWRKANDIKEGKGFCFDKWWCQLLLLCSSLVILQSIFYHIKCYGSDRGCQWFV